MTTKAGSNQLKDLIGHDLSGFKVIVMTEVYTIDDDGRKCDSIGFFRNQTIGEAFAGQHSNAGHTRTDQVLVLTNGTAGYVMESKESVKLFNDEDEVLKIKQGAIAKLSPAERKLFGF